MKDRYVSRIVLLLMMALLVGVMWRTIAPQQSAARAEVAVTVSEGESFGDFAQELEDRGIVKSALVLKLKAEKKGLDRKLQPGKYTFLTNSDYDEVLAIIERGPEKEMVKVTIPEGYTLAETAARLEEIFGWSSGEFLQLAENGRDRFKDRYPFLNEIPVPSLEGYLFPDTYLFEKKATPEAVAAAMLANFAGKLEEVGEPQGKAAGYSLHELITVASIIEKEAKLPEERPLVASVIYNRLEKGMLLQMCATVQYALGEPKPKLTEDDLKIDSPYNTYLNPGLPPGPICNPGLASIKAAFRPADTDYLYYVLIDDETGRHFFTSSYREFVNKKKSR